MHQNYSNHFLNERMNRIWRKIYTDICPLNFRVWRTKEPVPFKDRMTGEEINVKIGEKWGEHWDCGWFHITGTVPMEARGKNIVLHINLSAEGCLYDNEGNPIMGLAADHERPQYTGSYEKKYVPITECAKGGEKIDYWIDAGCNGIFGNYLNDGKIEKLHIAEFNAELYQLYYDLLILRQLMEQLPENTARRKSIYYCIMEAASMVIRYTPEEIKAAREVLARELSKKGGDPSLTLTAIGHAHLDLAWLWPIRQTKRKGVGTFATAIKNIERYPDYIFGASQAQLYEWVKDEHPALFEKIKKAVKDGRWEVQGGMWVEADANIPSGESLVRQFLYGKRFFRKEFGLDMKMLWLPDVFGYNGNLPQIMKKSGVDYFMTIKLSWSTINKFPYHTFNWIGIDGSKVLAHMAPNGDYNSGADPRTIKFSETNYCELGKVEEALLIYGCGDGGGGPSDGHLEALKREKDLSGLARVNQGKAIELFERLAKNADKYSEWVGELYLEKHQGTYTTHARNKYYNRKMELAIRELEFAASMAHLLHGYPYPKEKIDRIWKNVLLYQFHDILPGSSIKRVYDESVPHYIEMYNEVREMTKEAYDCLNDSDKAVAVNSLSWNRDAWIKYADKWYRLTLPSFGTAPVSSGSLLDTTEVQKNLKAGNNVLENENIRVTFNDAGNIVSVYNKKLDFEAVKPGEEANRLTIYNDDLDAWDFMPNYRQEVLGDMELQSINFYIDGPQAVAETLWTFGNSKLSQKVVLESGSDRVDFVTEVDWHESEKMLRAGFPLNVSSDRVISEIPFGNIARSTNTNTTWEQAQFEICAHKWIDISQEDFGVALLNDSKYGHSVRADYIDIDLLRSSVRPGVEADQGTHYFTYSIYPHKGDYREGKVVHKAYELNVPVYVRDGELTESVDDKNTSFVNVSKDNIIVDTVKKAEDDDNIVVRAYESEGIRTNCEMSFGFNVEKAYLTDLMENVIRELQVKNNKITLDFGRFEINTIKLVAKG